MGKGWCLFLFLTYLDFNTTWSDQVFLKPASRLRLRSCAFVRRVFKADPVEQTEPGHGRIEWKRVGERERERERAWGDRERSTMGEERGRGVWGTERLGETGSAASQQRWDTSEVQEDEEVQNSALLILSDKYYIFICFKSILVIMRRFLCFSIQTKKTRLSCIDSVKSLSSVS